MFLRFGPCLGPPNDVTAEMMCTPLTHFGQKAFLRREGGYVLKPPPAGFLQPPPPLLYLSVPWSLRPRNRAAAAACGRGRCDFPAILRLTPKIASG